MTLQPSADTVPPDPLTRAARVLSDVFAPAVSVFLICVLCAAAGSAWSLSGLVWGIVGGVFCAVVPMAAIRAAVRRKRLTDRHVTRREQRWWVFLVCVGSVLCGIAVSILLGAPDLLVWALLTMVGGLAVAGGATALGPKISMHAFCFTSLVLMAAMLASPWLLLALPSLLPVVAFARLRLRHHTVAELALGTGLAAAVVISARLLVPDLG